MALYIRQKRVRLSDDIGDNADDIARTALRHNTDMDELVKIYIHKDFGKQNLMPL